MWCDFGLVISQKGPLVILNRKDADDRGPGSKFQLNKKKINLVLKQKETVVSGIYVFSYHETYSPVKVSALSGLLCAQEVPEEEKD